MSPLLAQQLSLSGASSFIRDTPKRNRLRNAASSYWRIPAASERPNRVITKTAVIVFVTQDTEDKTKAEIAAMAAAYVIMKLMGDTDVPEPLDWAVQKQDPGLVEEVV